MARTLGNVTVSAKLAGRYTNVRDVDNAVLQFTKQFEQIFSDGVGANKAQVYFDDIRGPIAAGANEDLDLFDGSLKDAFGGSLVFSSIKAMLICGIGAVGDPANISAVRVGGAAATIWEPWTPDTGARIDVFPGGAQLFVAPDATGLPVSGAAKLLRIANPSAGSDTIKYTIAVLGEGVATDP
ncbi:hypothetical protein LCGC14_1361120 [marine sediment metagenome]|uniref:Uncharacterized protein n=1 Tax=marine sediment metagenome TaxID=412755 RepID=A0A0F9NAE4_9ZZZZ